MAAKRRWCAPAFILALALGACVSVEEGMPSLPPGSVEPRQRVVLVVHVSPGPLLAEGDSKFETAAKAVPGLGLLVQSAQNDRLLEASRELASAVPKWDPEGELYDALLTAFKADPPAPAVLSPAEVHTATGAFRAMNAANDPLQWRNRYSFENTEFARLRDYSRLMPLDDALILEANLSYGLELDSETKAAPSAAVVLRLVRVSNVKKVWRREEVAVDAGVPVLLADLKRSPEDLVARWRKLLPVLAAQCASSWRLALSGSPRSRPVPEATATTLPGDKKPESSVPFPDGRPPLPPDAVKEAAKPVAPKPEGTAPDKAH